MGWRHWKAFYAHIDQSIMEAMMDEMVAERPVVGEKGAPTLGRFRRGEHLC